MEKGAMMRQSVPETPIELALAKDPTRTQLRFVTWTGEEYMAADGFTIAAVKPTEKPDFPAGSKLPAMALEAGRNGEFLAVEEDGMVRFSHEGATMTWTTTLTSPDLREITDTVAKGLEWAFDVDVLDLYKKLYALWKPKRNGQIATQVWRGGDPIVEEGELQFYHTAPKYADAWLGYKLLSSRPDGAKFKRGFITAFDMRLVLQTAKAIAFVPKQKTLPIRFYVHEDKALPMRLEPLEAKFRQNYGIVMPIHTGASSWA